MKASKERAIFDCIFHVGHKLSFSDFETFVKTPLNLDFSSESLFGHLTTEQVGGEVRGILEIFITITKVLSNLEALLS